MKNLINRIHESIFFNITTVASKLSLFIVLVMILFYSSSCVSYKNQIFFQGLNDTTYTSSMKQPELVFQRGDQLSIMVYTTDPLAAAYYNQPMGGQAGGGMLQNAGQSGGTIIGYLVDENGEITFPKLGNINVLGLTQQKLQDTIMDFVKPYAKDAVVSVRLLNFRVTFINANKASTVTILNNKTNILQFFGNVGGVDWMDKRDDLMLIRQVNDQRTVYRLNLTDKSIFSSPAFYLQPNDVVYVEPNKRKFLETNAQLINLFTGVMSAVSIIIVLVNTVF
jgi:polysaccharide export outer membrane protein